MIIFESIILKLKKLYKMKKLHLILLTGRSGCTKSTTARGLSVFISDSKHLDIGDLLRGSPDAYVRDLALSGQKVDTKFIKVELERAIESTSESTIILSSMPRSIKDAELVLGLESYFFKVSVVVLEASEEVCRERLINRSGSRADDKDLVKIQSRLAMYDETMKSVHYLEENNIPVYTVNTEQRKTFDIVEEITNDIFHTGFFVRAKTDIVITAPSGGGKGTLLNNWLKDRGLNIFWTFVISCTTREPRDGEVHGKDYCFISVEEFKTKIENNEFVEWEEVYKGIFYGTLKSEVDRIHETGKYCIFDIDVKGAESIRKSMPNTLILGILPPDLLTLEERLKTRKTESKEKIQERILKASFEIEFIRTRKDVIDQYFINGDKEGFLRKIYAYTFVQNSVQISS